jgi:O-acetyl-ADP-ribose deacetylase (regulator of RNase III)
VSEVRLQIRVVQGSILEVDVQAIVNLALVPRVLQTVVLVDVDPAMVQAWREALKEIK